ncbi:hypothetical protein QSV08_04100 [Maribacter sp. BPC-D8]|uniref:hypothetical protein n=1 Tax=Maribacter sp. BPC-D8 TaxID=3053613 RepID=UPI002B49FCAF|nr:hypothetical protein [Maribacter sp. BPC-D8]WRI30426.1 hypothetical protein QSV08_04100 [Maribacter sp. BPC-D8]
MLYLPKKDFRSKLSEEILKKEHTEVSINHEGRRIIKDPNPGYFEFLGKGAGKVKCNNPKADEKCLEFKSRYEEMKKDAQVLIKQ